MAMEIEAARLLVWRACDAVDRARDAGLLGSYAKAFAADAAMRATTEAVQILGGAGIMGDHPVEKWFRDAKVFQIVEGTSEIQRLIVAAYLKRGLRERVRA
jgi:acyl-CoA dehydrogenase